VTGAKSTCLHGSAMAGFEYRQATEIRDALARHGVRYLFIGKSGPGRPTILLNAATPLNMSNGFSSARRVIFMRVILWE
jgi:hypothetical protein